MPVAAVLKFDPDRRHEDDQETFDLAASSASRSAFNRSRFLRTREPASVRDANH